MGDHCTMYNSDSFITSHMSADDYDDGGECENVILSFNENTSSNSGSHSSLEASSSWHASSFNIHGCTRPCVSGTD